MDLNINSSSKSPPFSPEELVLAFAKDACPLESTTFYYSLVRRQYGLNGGCSTFALRDSIEFFRTSFFKEIQSEKTEKKGFRAITHLPPTFMQSTQSLQKIDEYVRLNPSLVKQKLGKRQLTLEESVKRRTYRKLDLNNSDKYINKYIDERTAKYQELLIEILKKATFPEKV
jgi:hypothetical protein